MKIAVIGGGAAGLTTAWLLEQDHEVTLYERDARLGGHAHTVNVELGDRSVPIEAGFEFFSEPMFPTFRRLLRVLDVPIRPFDMTIVLHDIRTGSTLLLPPFRRGGLYPEAFRPRNVLDLVRFQRILREAATLMERPDTATTVSQFLDRLSLPERFTARVAYPYFQAGWGVSRKAIEGFSAYNVLRYWYLNRPKRFLPRRWEEVDGGSQRYVAALVASLTHARLERGTGVCRVVPVEAGLAVVDDSGRRETFEQVVLATNANQAAGLLADDPHRAAMRQLLNEITYFRTTIAVHGDPRLMPARRRHWSVVNIRSNGQDSQITIWKRWKSDVPVFRSWVTHESLRPDPLYAVVEYRHPLADPAYFRAQQALRRQQGANGLWLAGTYMHDVDCHESAVVSGIKVAQALAPDSQRLKQLA